MNQEVEIKVYIKNPKKVEERILELGKFLKFRKQVDKYFVPPHKDYFKDEITNEYLRVRYEKNGNHINYSFCNRNKKNELISTEEYETPVENPKIAEKILLKIGMKYRVTVNKNRKYFNIEGFEVVLDYIKELGYFLEIEAKKDFGGLEKSKKACFLILKKLNVEYSKCPNMGYPDMIMRNL